MYGGIILEADKKKKLTANEEIDKALGRSKGGWGAGLGQRTAKNSVKTVFLNFKEYASFFAALFIIQSLFWLLCFTTSTNIDRERDTIESRYDYHLLIENLSAQDVTAIENELVLREYQDIRSFDEYEFIPPDDVRNYYSLRVVLREGSEASTFLSYYIDRLGISRSGIEITYTPLYTYMDDYIADNMRNGIILIVLMTVLSAIVLVSLYSIRLNHYKFLYGIYMTCGAGFRKLFGNAVWEMMVISAATLFASFGVTALTTSLMYAAVGASISIYWWMIPTVAVLNLITVYISVRAPVKRLSKKTPLSLIVAQDNSNLVASPRRSFKIFNKTFPYHYELFTTWRFRRYFLRTLITSIIFTSLFICGIYIGKMVRSDEAAYGPELIAKVDLGDIDLKGLNEDAFDLNDAVDIMSAAQAEGIEPLDGVSYTVWENSTAASAINSHILLGRDQIAAGYGYTVAVTDIKQGYDRATNAFSYTAFDEHYIDTVCSRFEVEGDPYEILHNNGKIIVSDSVFNQKGFAFKPGDKISMAKHIGGILELNDLMSMDDNEILKKQLAKMRFEYEEYEIAAVIHGGEADKNFIVGMNYDDYMRFTGESSLSGAIMIWADSDVDAAEAETLLTAVNKNLNSYIRVYMMDCQVQRNYTALRGELVAQRCTYAKILIISVLLLLLSPVVWFFSQLLFYFKREKEINILRMFGAKEKSLRGIYTFAGLIMAVLATVVTVLLGMLSGYVVYRLFNNILPKYGFVSGTRFDFDISLPALLICLVLSVLCGFLSSYIPYRIGHVRRRREYARQLSEQN